MPAGGEESLCSLCGIRESLAPDAVARSLGLAVEGGQRTWLLKVAVVESGLTALLWRP